MRANGFFVFRTDGFSLFVLLEIIVRSSIESALDNVNVVTRLRYSREIVITYLSHYSNNNVLDHSVYASGFLM